MTEMMGGSDVRNSTETVAVHRGGNEYFLTGLKWFTSAFDADISFTLAKIKDPETGKVDASPTLFFLKVKDSKGKLNNITPIRLKDKLGTRQVKFNFLK
jgi:alkylation response protein AidB-like acyl-CoA dehydrogenase